MTVSWGPEVIAEYGSPISATDMCLGIPDFGILALLYDELYGFPHTEREFEDVVLHWNYNAYIFGVAEEILPGNTEEAIDLMDYLLSTQGPGSRWSPELSAALMGYVAEMVDVIEPGWVRPVVKKIGLPLFYGFVREVIGQPLTRRMLADVAPEAAGRRGWATSARALAVLSARLEKVHRDLDTRRGGNADCGSGDPVQNWLHGKVRDLSEIRDLRETPFDSHDESKESDFARQRAHRAG